MDISAFFRGFWSAWILFSMVGKCFTCPGKHFPKSLAERVLASDVIIWGEIVSKNADLSRSTGTDVAYSAEVRVRCVLKGRVGSRIIVDDVGKRDAFEIKRYAVINQDPRAGISRASGIHGGTDNRRAAVRAGRRLNHHHLRFAIRP